MTKLHLFECGQVLKRNDFASLVDFAKEDVELDSAFNMLRGDEPFFDNSSIFLEKLETLLGVTDDAITAKVELITQFNLIKNS